MVLQSDVPALGRRLAQKQGGARGRIHLHAVMHFDNFDIKTRVERPCRLLHQRGQNIHPEAHIAGLDDDGVPRGGLELGEMRLR